MIGHKHVARVMGRHTDASLSCPETAFILETSLWISRIIDSALEGTAVNLSLLSISIRFGDLVCS